MRHLALMAAAGMLALASPAMAQDPDPDEFTPQGYEFCGWQDLVNGGWRMEWSEDLAGAYVVSFADGMSCRAARRNIGRTKTRQTPPYAPYRTGYRCKTLKQQHEFSDVRCTKIGATRKYRYQTGA